MIFSILFRVCMCQISIEFIFFSPEISSLFPSSGSVFIWLGFVLAQISSLLVTYRILPTIVARSIFVVVSCMIHSRQCFTYSSERVKISWYIPGTEMLCFDLSVYEQSCLLISRLSIEIQLVEWMDVSPFCSLEEDWLVDLAILHFQHLFARHF